MIRVISLSALKDINADLLRGGGLPDASKGSMEHASARDIQPSCLTASAVQGAAPINHAIINGETRTGVTTFLIDKEIDTGMILLSRETGISPDETAGSLHDRLMETGASLVVDTARGLAARSLKPVPQKKTHDAKLKPAPKIFPADTVIRWEEKAEKIHNLVRPFTYPGATTMLRKESASLRLKILGSTISNDITGNIPGTLIVKEKSRLMVACGQGALEVLSPRSWGRRR